MKKAYEGPRAEKTEFDYSEVVVASGCSGGVTIKYINNGYGCDTTPIEVIDPYSSN